MLKHHDQDSETFTVDPYCLLLGRDGVRHVVKPTNLCQISKLMSRIEELNIIQEIFTQVGFQNYSVPVFFLLQRC